MTKSTIGTLLMDKQANLIESKSKSKMVNQSKFAVRNFETLFGQHVGIGEKLIADYSGAILRDMVIAGRLYITSNHLCFYGSFLKWETRVVIKLSDIVSVVKAKTIKVIPNAIQIITRMGDKYLFTSLVSRQKVYQTLVSTWTGNQSPDLVTDDSEGDKLPMDSSIRKCYSNLESRTRPTIYSQICDTKQLKSKRKYLSTGDLTDFKLDSDNNNMNDNLMQIDGKSDTLVTNQIDKLPLITIDKPIRDPTKCPYSEPCLVDIVLPINLNRLFEMIFTESPFNLMFLESLKHRVTIKRNWSVPSECDLQKTVNSTVAVKQIGRDLAVDYPFTKSVSSDEMMFLEHFEASNFYGIKLLTESSGAPLCSSFYVFTSYCLHRTNNPMETHFHFHNKIVFKSKAWGFKSFIEEGTKRACLDYIDSLIERAKQWSVDNPEYILNRDLPLELKPFDNHLNGCNETQSDCNQLNDDPITIREPVISQSTSESSNFAQQFKSTESNQPAINRLSSSSQRDGKSSIPNCNCQLNDSHLLNIVKYLKPLIVFLLILTIVNLFLMIRLLRVDNFSSSFCLSNQVSSKSNLIGLTNRDETFESLSNYAFPTLGCHR